jgi:CRP-like cAMP-binding protein
MSGRDVRARRRVGAAQNAGATAPGWTKDERHQLLTQVGGFEFFARCTEHDLGALLDASVRFAVPAGWPLMHETTPADACYAITGGSAAVFRGREQIASLSTGAIVGEMAVLTGTLRRATVTSLTAVRGLRVDNEALETLLVRRPSLLAALRGAYEARVHTSPNRTRRDALRAAVEALGPLPVAI